MIKWESLQNQLWDSDGNHPDDEQLVSAMREFRDTGAIQGYWFVDVTKPGTGPDRDQYPDPWHGNIVCHNWDIGPDPCDIDFTGLD